MKILRKKLFSCIFLSVDAVYSTQGDNYTMHVQPISEFVKEQWNNHNTLLGELLRSKAQELSIQLEDFFTHEKVVGFVKDSLDRVSHFQFPSSSGEGICFLADYNPARTMRFHGAGRKDPPAGVLPTNNGCYLDLDNMWWQNGIQHAYPVELNGRKYNFLAQPFPLAPMHFTVAAATAMPQVWKGKDALKKLLSDLYRLAVHLPDYLILYNGEDAGASIRNWLHFHALIPFSSRQPLPIQQAARLAEDATRPSGVLRISEPYYPIPAFRVRGSSLDEVVDGSADIILRWHALAGDRATESLSAMREGDCIAFYVVPRDRSFANAPGFAGAVGSYEAAAGVFVFGDDAEGEALQRQQIDFNYLWHILKAVRPFHSSRL